MQQLSCERANRSKDQLHFQETTSSLQQRVLSEQQAAAGMMGFMNIKWGCKHVMAYFRLLNFISVLRSEIHDLRLVLQSSDKELATVKEHLKDSQTEQQKEMSQLSSSLISTQLQLNKVQ